MCGDLLSPDAPKLRKPPAPEPKKPQATPQFGAANKSLNSSKNMQAKKRGTSGFKIDLQTPNKKSGLNTGGA